MSIRLRSEKKLKYNFHFNRTSPTRLSSLNLSMRETVPFLQADGDGVDLANETMQRSAVRSVGTVTVGHTFSRSVDLKRGG